MNIQEMNNVELVSFTKWIARLLEKDAAATSELLNELALRIQKMEESS
jgi:hypothetical protein